MAGVNLHVVYRWSDWFLNTSNDWSSWKRGQMTRDEHGSPPSGIGALSRFWRFCLGPMVYLLPFFVYLVFQSFDYVFQKRVMRTKFVIYVFIIHNFTNSVFPFFSSQIQNASFWEHFVSILANSFFFCFFLYVNPLFRNHLLTF